MKKDRKYFEYSSCGETYRVRPIVSIYGYDNSLYIGLIADNGEYLGDITVMLEAPKKYNEAFLDVNEEKNIEKIIQDLNLGKPTGEIMQSGFVEYPKYIFNFKELKTYFEEDEESMEYIIELEKNK